MRKETTSEKTYYSQEIFIFEVLRDGWWRNPANCGKQVPPKYPIIKTVTYFPHLDWLQLDYLTFITLLTLKCKLYSWIENLNGKSTFFSLSLLLWPSSPAVNSRLFKRNAPCVSVLCDLPNLFHMKTAICDAFFIEITLLARAEIKGGGQKSLQSKIKNLQRQLIEVCVLICRSLAHRLHGKLLIVRVHVCARKKHPAFTENNNSNRKKTQQLTFLSNVLGFFFPPCTRRVL